MLSVEKSASTASRTAHFRIWSSPPPPERLETAFDKLRSYVAPHTKRPPGVEDNDIERASIVALLIPRRYRDRNAATGEEALEKLRQQVFDCCVVDLRLPDMSGFELSNDCKPSRGYATFHRGFTGKELAAEEEARLRTVAKSVVLKDVQSPERLFDETSLFLHPSSRSCRRTSGG